MKKNKKSGFFLRKFILCIFSAVSVFLAGCEITNHAEDALERARKFALEEARDLSEYQRNIIRYSLPVIQGQMIFKTEPIKLTEYEHIPRNEFHKPLETKHLDYVASCFVWKIPDLGGEVVVYGTGDRNFRFWQPLKVMYRKLAEPDEDYIKAWKKAVSFTEDNMLYITDTERDRIRFSEARVWCTAFDLKYLDEDKPIKPETTWTSYLLKKQGGKKEKYQVSLVWQADDPGKFIVFTGLGADIPVADKKFRKDKDGEEDAEKSGKKKEFSLLKNWNILTVRVIDKVKFSKYVTEFKYPVEEGSYRKEAVDTEKSLKEKTVEKTEEKVTEKTEEKSAEKTEEKVTEKSTEKKADSTEEKK